MGSPKQELLADDTKKESARQQFTNLINQLSELNNETLWDQEWANQVHKTATALNSYLLASVSSFGECRKDTPYKPLRPVIDANGNFKWCCEHDPEHCV